MLFVNYPKPIYSSTSSTMGNEQSSSNKGVDKKPKGIPENEVKRLLEQQRRTYEQKLKEAQTRAQAQVSGAANARAYATSHLNADADASSSNTNPVHNHRQATELAKDALQQQAKVRQLSVDDDNKKKTKPLCPSPLQFGAISPQSHSYNLSSVERECTPCCLTQEHLQRPATSTTSRNTNPFSIPVETGTSLYPILGNSNNTDRAERDDRDTFVFVNSNIINSRYQSATPSAPAFEPSPRSNGRGRYRDRSLSSNRPRRSEEDVELNCPTCNNKYGLNIFQCPSGHSSCKNCQENNSRCGLCNQMITTMRNITLEAYVSERRVACPNADHGCCLSFKMSDIDSHMNECPYNNIQCPMNAVTHCGWKGKVPALLGHFDCSHKKQREAKPNTEMCLRSILTENHNVYLIDIGIFTFLMHLKIDIKDKKIYMVVQLMGTHYSASKWSYEIQVYNKKEPRRKYQSSEICVSNASPVDELLRKSKCIVIPLAHASTFLNNEGFFTFKFFLRKECENGPSYRGKGRGRGRGAKNLNSWSIL